MKIAKFSLRKMFVLSPLLLGFLFVVNASFACTTVFWNNNKQAKTVARTMDLYTSDQPNLVVFPRGTTRIGDAGENSLQWQAKYGSVAVTAFHTDVMSDGMNEAGFSAHLLYLDKTQYEKRDTARPGIANTLWAQYMLDNFQTVKEALANINKVQIVSAVVQGREWPIHLALEDPSGDSAIIEFIDGKMTIHHGSQYRVMTNEPAYDIQLNNLKRYKLFGGNLPMPGDVDPLSRFVRASSYLKTLPQPGNYNEAIAGVLSVIRTTMVPFGAQDTSGGKAEDSWPTRWVATADLTNKIYYFNSTTAPNIIWLDFKNLNFAEGQPVISVDPTQVKLIGEVSKSLIAEE